MVENNELPKHLHRSFEVTRALRNFSFALKKANFGGLNLQTTVLATGAGQGLLLCPQVDL